MNYELFKFQENAVSPAATYPNTDRTRRCLTWLHILFWFTIHSVTRHLGRFNLLLRIMMKFLEKLANYFHSIFINCNKKKLMLCFMCPTSRINAFLLSCHLIQILMASENLADMCQKPNSQKCCDTTHKKILIWYTTHGVKSFCF